LHILNKVLPQLVLECLVVSSHNLADINQHVDSVEDQAWLQGQLEGAGLVAFVRNGAILPRSSGIDDRPMSHQIAIPFQSPSSLQVSFTLPNAGTSVSGMGIRKGITLICGGGFHGKSTLLEALQLAVYYKIPGDGREFCVSSVKSVKIRAEDGRCVTAVDISSFIKNLPFGKDTSCFTTSDASGSTSQAANIVEVRYYPLAMKYCYFRRCCMLNERVQLFIQCVWPPRWTFFPG
jgi:predicted ABC-class ATPase